MEQITKAQASVLLRKIGTAILETIAAVEPDGAPAGAVYSALQPFGCKYAQFTAIIEGLKGAKLIRQSNNQYFLTENGRKAVC